KNNRHGSVFKCKNCGYELNADLNASRNIEVLGTSEYIRLLSASQSLRFNKTPLMVDGEPSNKLRSFSEE
ncbi:MAG: zinc ribbon domain-containing protein, partial [Thermoplasmata archaeon]